MKSINGNLAAFKREFRRPCPGRKVQELRDRFAELEKQIETLNNNLEALEG